MSKELRALCTVERIGTEAGAFSAEAPRESDMWLTDRDSFEVYRFLLGTVCTIYALVVTTRSLWDWIVYLSYRDRQTRLLRQYVIVQLLRLRCKRFAGEMAMITLYLFALAAVLYAHRWV